MVKPVPVNRIPTLLFESIQIGCEDCRELAGFGRLEYQKISESVIIGPLVLVYKRVCKNIGYADRETEGRGENIWGYINV